MMTVLHVFFGALALVAAPAALFMPKGGSWHSRFGFAFILTMAIVLFSAGFLWQKQGHLFLLPLGAVSGYLIFNAYRVIARRRRREPDWLEDRIDMLAAGVAIAAALGTAYLAATAATPLMFSIRPALIGIAAIAIAFASNDVLGFCSPRSRHGWLLAHFAGMIAAYISAVTAFAVINAHNVPMMVRWIVPSAGGGMLIVGLTLRYVRFGRPGRKRPENPANPVATATAPGRPLIVQ